jgi:YVTN family beta-propeller protein
MTKRGRLIVIAVSIAISLSAFGLPVTAYGLQNSAQSNPGGYVKYTLDLANNTLLNGNFANIGNALLSWGIAYDPSNGYIYVTDEGSDTVSVINGKTNTVIATIPVEAFPEGIVYDPSNGCIYVADDGWRSVSVINGTTVIATIHVEQGPWGIAYDPSNGYIYVTNLVSGTVSIIFTGVSTSSTSTSSVTAPTTSTSTRPTPSVAPALAVVAAVVVVVLVVALLMIKHRKPQL